jgi:hypothetical protein
MRLRLIAILTAVFGQVGQAAIWPEASIGVQVTDEDGAIARQAEISVGYEDGSGKVLFATGKSDEQGCFRFKANMMQRVTATVKKAGYYSSVERYNFNLDQLAGLRIFPAKWTPYEVAIPVVIKKIINPIPMYAKKVRIELPVVDKETGFDLMESDWVTPYGKGKISDFNFYIERDFKSRTDYKVTLRLKFFNQGDGLQNAFAGFGSELRLPNLVTEGLYVTTWERTDSYPAYVKVDKDQNYFFRVRTILDDTGKVSNALYGKIHGEIRFDVINSKTAIILFTYYLNPTVNDRNVEFDPRKNLFGKLEWGEAVREP